MQYQLVYAGSFNGQDALEELETQVQELCAIGWKPHGGIAICETDCLFRACQAMIKQ